ECHDWEGYLEFWPELYSVAQGGRQAIAAVCKAQQAEDPFAFLDQPATGKEAVIDTTPQLPRPPAALVEAAARAIPAILATVQPAHDGTIGLQNAAHLASRIEKAGHAPAAAQWAIHEAVRAGRLRAGVAEVELPRV